jgi:hypothetical protein
VDWPDLWILLGTGTGSFNAATTSVPGQNPSIVAAGDLDRDGHTDLVVDLTGHVAVLHGTGLGTFLPAGLADLAGLDDDRSGVDFVRLGALSVKTGAWGRILLDEFASTRPGPAAP